MRVNAREHLAIYTLATLANLLISIPQYIAVNSALQLGVNLKGTTENLTAVYGSSTGLVFDFVRSSLIFQGLMAVLVVCVTWSASSIKGWRWQYTLTSVIASGYLGYHLGREFLNALGWIGVLHASGFDVSNVYAELFWFGLGTTTCYLLTILVLRRSFGKLLAQRGAFEPNAVTI